MKTVLSFHDNTFYTRQYARLKEIIEIVHIFRTLRTDYNVNENYWNIFNLIILVRFRNHFIALLHFMCDFSLVSCVCMWVCLCVYMRVSSCPCRAFLGNMKNEARAILSWCILDNIAGLVCTLCSRQNEVESHDVSMRDVGIVKVPSGWVFAEESLYFRP